MQKKDITVTRTKITAIIPSFNEEKNIEKALKSVLFADEIIVVDSFSTDKTVEIAEKYATKVIQHIYESPSKQKNWIIPQAKHQWIILLDADEWITDSLQSEIEKTMLDTSDNDCYWIGRDNFFMGEQIKYSGWQGDKVIRLFKKTCKYNNKHVHEEIVTENKKVAWLINKLSHNTYTSIDNYISKLNRYAEWQAKDYDGKVKKITFFHLAFKPIHRFVKHYFIKGGILDGVPGFTISILQAYAVGMRYVKLWLLRKKMK